MRECDDCVVSAEIMDVQTTENGQLTIKMVATVDPSSLVGFLSNDAKLALLNVLEASLQADGAIGQNLDTSDSDELPENTKLYRGGPIS